MSTISGTGSLDLDENYRILHVAIQTRNWETARKYCDSLYKRNFDDYLVLLRNGEQETIEMAVGHLNTLSEISEKINKELLNQGENN